MGCCCYSFFGINECITLADDTAYSFCEYSQLSVNGYLHKTDTWCWSLPFFSHFTIERTVFKFTFRWATATFLMSMLRGETAYCGFGFYTPPQNPLTLSANLDIQSTCKGHFTTVFSHKYARKEERLRESIEKL